MLSLLLADLQGTCETRRLHNVSAFTAYRGDTAGVNQFVASNDPRQPTVAFLGPGPAHPPPSRDRAGSRDADVMYVGSSFSGDTEVEHALRQHSVGISSRSLPPDQPPFQVLLCLSPHRHALGTFLDTRSKCLQCSDAVGWAAGRASGL